MAEETNELNEKDVQRIADALYKKMKEKQEKEMKEQIAKEKENSVGHAPSYAICNNCGKELSYDQYYRPACPYCGGTKARIITK